MVTIRLFSTSISGVGLRPWHLDRRGRDEARVGREVVRAHERDRKKNVRRGTPQRQVELKRQEVVDEVARCRAESLDVRVEDLADEAVLFSEDFLVEVD